MSNLKLLDQDQGQPTTRTSERNCTKSCRITQAFKQKQQANKTQRRRIGHSSGSCRGGASTSQGPHRNSQSHPRADENGRLKSSRCLDHWAVQEWREQQPGVCQASRRWCRAEMGNWVIGNWKLIESTTITNYIW